jgi:hypothetical protein
MTRRMLSDDGCGLQVGDGGAAQQSESLQDATQQSESLQVATVSAIGIVKQAQSLQEDAGQLQHGLADAERSHSQQDACELGDELLGLWNSDPPASLQGQGSAEGRTSPTTSSSLSSFLSLAVRMEEGVWMVETGSSDSGGAAMPASSLLHETEAKVGKALRHLDFQLGDMDRSKPYRLVVNNFSVLHEVSKMQLDALETVLDSAVSCCKKFYIGICVDPVNRMEHPTIGHYTVHDYDAMTILAVGDAIVISAAEDFLIEQNKDSGMCTNRAKGRGGRCPAGVVEYLYVVHVGVALEDSLAMDLAGPATKRARTCAAASGGRWA